MKQSAPDEYITMARWKYEYIFKKLGGNDFFLYCHHPQSMLDTINRKLSYLEKNEAKVMKNRMDNAWRQYKKRWVDHKNDTRQRTFLMHNDDYLKLAELAKNQKISVNELLSKLIKKEHARNEKRMSRTTKIPNQFSQQKMGFISWWTNRGIDFDKT